MQVNDHDIDCSRPAWETISSMVCQDRPSASYKSEIHASVDSVACPLLVPALPPLLSCHFADSVKDGPCPRQIKRQKTKQKNENGPHPLIASSSSRRYLQPKVKSMLQLGVETGEKG